ncbi:MAG: DEAD/DEAH box helicase family protein, partial [Myxococcota bacterium]
MSCYLCFSRGLVLSSPFSEIPESEWLASNALAFAIFDGYPVSEGHALVIPHREVATWFEATEEEQRVLMSLVDEVKNILDERFSPDGYNIGINAGEAAGQTVMHLHVHVIPRYRGDMPDPRGGVRHVIPWKGNYKTEDGSALTTGEDDPFMDRLRPLFARASRVAIVAAFVQDSGLELLRGPVLSLLEREAQVRLLTGDYLNITQARALRRLLDWKSGLATDAKPNLDVRVVEVGSNDGWPKSFHPKSWRFESDDFGVAYVGSSNISRMALSGGVEWNLRVRRRNDPGGYEEVATAFESRWQNATPLDHVWLDSYELRARATDRPLPPGEEEQQTPSPVPTPHGVQAEALESLQTARDNGRQRALVVHATGLGKTWLSAFDVRNFADYFHRAPRILFLAHRAEILAQAADTFRKILPDANFGWYIGSRGQTQGDVVFASVQKMTLEDNLAEFEPTSFDYVIVDEVHHAAAPSYRRIIEHLEPQFLLGLTATPDRADEADIRPLFDDFVAHRAGIGEGIERGYLCPFHYYGLADPTNYDPIPWRSGRFQTTALTEALATQKRMERVWEALEEHPGESSLVFCCSIDHARFVKQWLSERGMDVAAIYSRPDADDREASLQALGDGELDAVCAVDILNEGVDIPNIDRVVMLRPTESPVVFMQQLGRGLRVAEDKEHLSVLDFVGNHRVFLDRVRMLLSLGPKTTSLREFLVKGEEPELPPGCHVDIELEAVELLEALLPQSSRSALVREYRELREAREERPRAVEMYRLGLNLRTAKKYGGWFGLLEDEGDLSEAELAAWRAGEAWFHELETTRMNKSFKMVVVQTLLDQDALESGMATDELADASHRLMVRSPELFQDLVGKKALPDPRHPDPDKWRAYWDRWPLQVWAGDKERDVENPWFSRPDGPDGDFVSNVPVPNDPDARDAFLSMTQELVDYRLARYRDRYDESAETGAFRAKVISNQRDPILSLPSRDKRPDIPHGETNVALPDGQKWRFRFVKVAVNVARPVGEQHNALPDLLRTWFGPAAGEPGTDFHVEFRPTRDGWQIEPLGEHVIPFPRPGHIVAFPNVRAAASSHRLPQEDHPRWTDLHVGDLARGEANFAVRATGDSMAGGEQPIHDGDWVLMRWARGESLQSVLGRVALVRHNAEDTDAPAYFLKRVVETDEGYSLRSDNPAEDDIPASEDTVVVALLVDALPADTKTTA